MKQEHLKELTQLLEEDHSKKQVLIIANLIEKNQSLLEVLIHLTLSIQPIVPQRASWVLDEIISRHPNWIEPYTEELSKSLNSLTHSGTRRNVTKILSKSPLPKANLGALLNTSFEWLLDKETAIAVRVHCMTILYQISKQEPEIKGELKQVLLEILEIGTAGERSRAKKTLKLLENVKPT